MRTVQIKQFGVEHLAVTDLPVPKPAKGEVLVRMKAVNLCWEWWLGLVNFRKDLRRCKKVRYLEKW